METKISTSDLNLYYGNNHALKNINLDIYENQITAFIGPSGCGKSTYLKTLNRMNDLVPNVTINGKVWIDGEDIYDPKVDTTVAVIQAHHAQDALGIGNAALHVMHADIVITLGGSRHDSLDLGKIGNLDLFHHNK